MKKILFILVLSLFIGQTACSAEIMRNQIAVGGIYPGRTTESEVERMHGKFDLRKGNGRYYYINGNPYDNPAATIGLMENRVIDVGTILSSWETPDGVHCGMHENVLNDVYGTADEAINHGGEVVYRYYSGSYVLEFWVRSSFNGKIHLIIAKMRD